MRCFIAVDINRAIQNQIADLQDELRDALPDKSRDIKWVDPDLIHVTLKFLGDVPDRDIVPICRVAEDVAARHDPFELAIQGVGHFRGKCARVLWAGARDGAEALENLHGDLEARLDEIGWPPEGRRFSAHLTICRTKSPSAGFELARIYVPWQDRDFGTTDINTLVVYHSQLTKQGPIYTPMGRYTLGELRDQ